MQEVVQNHNWWGEFGNAPDPNELPPAKLEAHFAIMEGKQARREDERKKAESKS